MPNRVSSINHVEKRGEGRFPKKNHVCPQVRGLSTWTKTFFGDPFFAREFKKGHENFKKKLYT